MKIKLLHANDMNYQLFAARFMAMTPFQLVLNGV